MSEPRLPRWLAIAMAALLATLTLSPTAEALAASKKKKPPPPTVVYEQPCGDVIGTGQKNGDTLVPGVHLSFEEDLGHYDTQVADGRPQVSCPNWNYTLTVYAGRDITQAPIGSQTLSGDDTNTTVQFEIDLQYPIGSVPGSSVCVVATNAPKGSATPDERVPEAGCFEIAAGTSTPSSNFH